MGNSLEALKKRCQLKPLPLATAIALDRGIHLAKGIDTWRSVLKISLPQLKAGDVLAAFDALEQRLERSDFSDYTRITISRTFRNFVTRHIAAEGQPVLAKRIQKTFRSHLTLPPQIGRDLISDLPKPGRAPVGAVAFGLLSSTEN
jgi:hypothetical protein